MPGILEKLTQKLDQLRRTNPGAAVDFESHLANVGHAIAAGGEPVVQDPASGKVFGAGGLEIALGGGGGSNPGEGSGSTGPTSMKTVIATTSATANDGTLAAFASAECDAIYINNQTGVDIEYQRGGAGGFTTVCHGQEKTIIGLTDASQVAVRCADYASATAKLRGSVIVRATLVKDNDFKATGGGIQNRAMTGGGIVNLSAQAATCCEVINNTGRDAMYRITTTGELTMLRDGDSALIVGIQNLNEIGVQPLGAFPDAPSPKSLSIEYFASGLKRRTMGSRPAHQVSPDAYVTLGENNLPNLLGDLPNKLFMGEIARGPRDILKPRGVRPLAIFTTVADMAAGSATARCADVATGEMLTGLTCIEFTQNGVNTSLLSPGGMVPPQNVNNGFIRFGCSFPDGAQTYVADGFNLNVQIFSEGTPAAPGAGYHEINLSANTPAFVDASVITARGRIFFFGAPTLNFIPRNGGADLTAIKFARFEFITTNASRNGAKFRPHCIEFVPNAHDKAVFCLSADDLRDAVYKNVLPLTRLYDFPLTMYGDPMSGAGRSSANKLTPAQLAALVNDHGWQIAHQNFARETLDYKNAAEMLRESSKHSMLCTVMGLGGEHQDSSAGSAPPITNWRDDNNPGMTRGFRTMARFKDCTSTAAAGVRSFPFGETLPFRDPKWITRWNWTAFNGSTPGLRATKVIEAIETTITEKGALFIGSHAEWDTPGHQHLLDLAAVLAHLNTRRDVIEVCTVERAVQLGYRRF